MTRSASGRKRNGAVHEAPFYTLDRWLTDFAPGLITSLRPSGAMIGHGIHACYVTPRALGLPTRDVKPESSIRIAAHAAICAHRPGSGPGWRAFAARYRFD